jgi:hypothetical protein
VLDPNDLALLSYVPVIRNRLNTEIGESVEEDKIMLAFFDSQVNRHHKKETESPKNKHIKKSVKKKDNGNSDSISSDNSTDKSSNSIFTSENYSELSSSESSIDDSTNSSLSETDCSKSSKIKVKSRTNFSSSPSSASSSAFTSSDDGSPNDFNVDNLLNKSSSKCSKNEKKSKNSLRNRIRNLRHRRSLHIETQSDFKQVLNSLKVEESEQDTNLNNSQPLVLNDSSHLEIEISSDSQKLSTFTSQTESNAESLLPKTSNYPRSNISTVKNLNEHKRRIKLNEDLILPEDTKTQRFNDEKNKIDSQDSDESEKQPLFKKKCTLKSKSTSGAHSANNYNRNYRVHNETSPNQSNNFSNQKGRKNNLDKSSSD